MKTHVFLFEAQFAPRIRDRTKVSTVRPVRDRPVDPGDVLDLRTWKEQAYRSPQVPLTHTVCTAADAIELAVKRGHLFITKRGFTMHTEEAEIFASEEGFDSFESLYAWFQARYNIARRPFRGVYYRWRYQ